MSEAKSQATSRTLARERYGLAVIYVALFLSGGAALVYQATWGRMLHRVFGVSDQAIATVLAAFFLGLGIGAALGGRWGTRFRRPALTYAALEAGIGVFALLSLVLIPRVHGIYAALGGAASGATLTVIRTSLALALLLPPTILMGATLPVLIALIAPDRKTWSTPATWLYATNTVGAMVGAGLTGLYLVPRLGARMSIIVAALASLGGAALVAVLWFEREVDTEEEEEEEEREEAPSRVGLAMVIAAVAGVAALASEVLWTRVLRMVVVGTTQSFSAMLVNYLAGIALGSLLAAELLRRGHRASVLLGASQVVLGVLTVVAMAVAPHLPRLIALMYGSQTTVPADLWVILIVSGLLLFPIALALGTSIPLCWKLAGSSQKQAARHAGRILAANTLGGLCGSMIAGFGAVPALGIDGSLIAVMFVHFFIGGVVLQMAVGKNIVRRALALSGPFALGMLLLSTSPTLHLPFLLHVRMNPRGIIGGPDDSWSAMLAFIEEGRNTTVTVTVDGNKLSLYNDGRPESHILETAPGIGPELVVLGSLPNLYAEPRERALVIGLGAGHTATMLLQGPWKEVHVVELEEGVVNAARFMHEQRGMPFPLDDARAKLSIDDGRAQLIVAPESSLDTVVSQPSHPWLAGSSALYTQEFFREVQRALRPTGTFALWVNLFRIEQRHVRRILATLVSVFPHVNGFIVEHSSLILIASESPLVLGERANQRYAELGIARYLKPSGLGGFANFVSARELDGSALGQLDLGGEQVIVDDRPALEFELANLPISTMLSRRQVDELFAHVPWISPEAYALLPAKERLKIITTHINQVSTRLVALRRIELSLTQLDLEPVEDALIRGGVAAARGEMALALDLLDAVEHPRTAALADKLRFHVQRLRELLERSKARKVMPSDPAPLISAALAFPDPDNMRHAIEVAKRAGRKSKTLTVLEAMNDEGCDGVMALEKRLVAETDDEYALFLAERCALVGEELSAARFFANERLRVRMGLASTAETLGSRHIETGNVGAAIVYLRRAVAKDPTRAVAAAKLAQALAETGDREGAAKVLHRAHYATRGLANAMQVRIAAQSLGIQLPK